MTGPQLSKFFVPLIAATLGCSVVLAQSSSRMVKADPDRQYEAVKQAMQSFYERGLLTSTIGEHGAHAEYDLWSCTDPAEFMGDSGLDLTDFVMLAATTVIWRNDFRKLGVPPIVWEGPVSSYESAALKHGGQLSNAQEEAGKKQIAAALNNYRRQSKPSLPRFIVEGGCGGAGEVEVHLTLQPPDGRLFLIPVFLYKVCQAQHLNPNDPGTCDRWTEVLNGTASYVSGDYIYMARWSDGAVRCGPLGFNNEVQEGKTFAITKMRNPECNPGW